MIYALILLCSLLYIATGQSFDKSSQGMSNMSEYPMPSNIKYATFFNNSISEVPVSYFTNFADLFMITLSNNPLSNIANFTFSGVPSVGKVIIKHHELTYIEKYAFSGLINMVKLTLTYVLIHTIHPESFQDNINITELYLSWNKLTVIQKELFAPLQKLEILQIHTNELHWIEGGSFKYNTVLGNLALQNNLLTSFPSSLFDMKHHSCNIGWFAIYYNPINCNESMCYLKHAEKDWITFKYPNILTCTGGNLDGRTWNTLQTEDICASRSLSVYVCSSSEAFVHHWVKKSFSNISGVETPYKEL